MAILYLLSAKADPAIVDITIDGVRARDVINKYVEIFIFVKPTTYVTISLGVPGIRKIRNKSPPNFFSFLNNFISSIFLSE